MSQYKVMVDDNFHYMDEDERWEHGKFSSAEEALDACCRFVDRSLLEEYREGATADELYERYISFGDEPFVIAPEGAAKVDFSARNYARGRARQLAEPGPGGARLRQLVLGRNDAAIRSKP